MKIARKTKLTGSLIVAGLCTFLLFSWKKLFGSVSGLLLYSVVRHGWKATFPDHHSLALLAIFLGLYGVKLMIRSLQKDAWTRSKSLLPSVLVLPPA